MFKGFIMLFFSLAGLKTRRPSAQPILSLSLLSLFYWPVYGVDVSKILSDPDASSSIYFPFWASIDIFPIGVNDFRQSFPYVPTISIDNFLIYYSAYIKFSFFTIFLFFTILTRVYPCSFSHKGHFCYGKSFLITFF